MRLAASCPTGLRGCWRGAGFGRVTAPLETLDLARILVQAGRPFAAHEVLEARWKAWADDERDSWQGLAQICVRLTHAGRGNSVGTVRLLERAAARLEEHDSGEGSTYGLDLTGVVACAREHTATAN